MSQKKRQELKQQELETLKKAVAKLSLKNYEVNVRPMTEEEIISYQQEKQEQQLEEESIGSRVSLLSKLLKIIKTR